MPACDGWLIQRPVEDSTFHDLASCYPLFFCANWRHLADDLAALDAAPISLVVVLDPFAQDRLGDLETCFPHYNRRFKSHYLVDLQQFDESAIDAHHRRNVRTGMAANVIIREDSPGASQPGLIHSPGHDLERLYHNLAARHRIPDETNLPLDALVEQLSLPALYLFKSRVGDETTGLTLWIVQDDVAYYHFAAYSDSGYRNRAAYALFFTALSHFRDAGLGWATLGGGAGMQEALDDGLVRFKRGWATESRHARLCGRILDPGRYDALVRERNGDPETFPAYRY